MSKKASNKQAWEHAYAHKNAYEDQLIHHLKNAPLYYLDEPLKSTIAKMDLKQKTVAQFCTNNGRELLSICFTKNTKGLGFDIAENMVEAANQHGRLLGLDTTFIATDIEMIGDEYANKADVLIVTVGALCWFNTLDVFFEKAAMVLKNDGILLIHESHPFTNVLASNGEEPFVAEQPGLTIYDYFENKEWVSQGMGYMSNEPSPTQFYSYTHRFETILNTMIQKGFIVKELQESNIDYSNAFSELNSKHVPLSLFIRAQLKIKQ